MEMEKPILIAVRDVVVLHGENLATERIIWDSVLNQHTVKVFRS